MSNYLYPYGPYTQVPEWNGIFFASRGRSWHALISGRRAVGHYAFEGGISNYGHYRVEVGRHYLRVDRRAFYSQPPYNYQRNTERELKRTLVKAPPPKCQEAPSLFGAIRAPFQTLYEED